jgi:hypothetical protein
MNFAMILPILAQAAAPATRAAQAAHPSGWMNFPPHWPAQADLLLWSYDMGSALALLLVLLGVVYLLFGFYLFKPLVLLNAAFIGSLVGVYISQKTGGPLPSGILGGFLGAALTYPLMKWAVAVMGGLFGAILGLTLWRTFGLEPGFAWTGGLMGLIGCGLLCFIVFRGSVMTYTSLQGSVMLVFGILGLIYKYQGIAPRLTESLQLKPFLLPMTVFIAAILGLIYQQNSELTAKASGGAPPPKK